MQIIRRFYFYLVTFISLEVVIWGVILLARTLISPLPIASASALLASGLSLVLVGLPIFLLHWITAERDALRSEEERSTRVRAIFLYGATLAVLIPVAQNVLAILDRLLLQLLGVPVSAAFLGANQSLADNLVAIAINLVAWAYLERVLRADREAWLEDNHLAETRRLYRYTWLVYALALTVMGTQRILDFLLSAPFDPQALAFTALAGIAANGIALALVGAPIWAWIWRLIQKALLKQPAERSAPLHLAVMYAVALLSAVIFVVAAAVFLAGMLQWLLEPNLSVTQFLDQESSSLSLAVPMAALWAYFSRERLRAARAESDPLHRAGLDRLYFYLLALTGNAATFLGLTWLIWPLTSMLMDRQPLTAPVVLDSLSSALGMLLVGLPVWISTWSPMQAEALRPAHAGDAARQSLVRRGYLYLVLFLTVVGAMAFGGTLLYLVLSNLLGSRSPDFVLVLVRRLFGLALVLVWLGYHWNVLRADQRRAHKALAERYTRFPVLIVQADDHPFAVDLAGALQRESPGLPVAVHRLDLSPLSDDLSEAKAVVLPAGLAARPPEALRLWLNEYPGHRLLAPLPAGGMTFVGASPRSDRELVEQTVSAVRSLAEGRPVRARAPINPWLVAGGALGALLLLFVLFGLISTILSVVD